MPDAPPFTVHDLRRLGAETLRRANDAMAHARHAGPGGSAGYTPLPETAAEHAGLYVVSQGSLRGALWAIDRQLEGLGAGENATLWREARAILATALAHVEGPTDGRAAGDDGTPAASGA
jgi:hypothetical protein